MEKLYYSISEVAGIVGITQSNLRFWEKEFDQLVPRRSPKGTRQYTMGDIEILKQIKYLTEDQKLTLQGAKARLSQKKDKVVRQQEIVERLRKIKAELMGISRSLKPE